MLIFVPDGIFLAARPCAVAGAERGRDAAVPLPGFLPASPLLSGSICEYLRLFDAKCKYLHSAAVIGRQEQNGSRTVPGRAERRRAGWEKETGQDA